MPGECVQQSAEESRELDGGVEQQWLGRCNLYVVLLSGMSLCAAEARLHSYAAGKISATFPCRE